MANDETLGLRLVQDLLLQLGSLQTSHSRTCISYLWQKTDLFNDSLRTCYCLLLGIHQCTKQAKIPIVESIHILMHEDRLKKNNNKNEQVRENVRYLKFYKEK